MRLFLFGILCVAALNSDAQSLVYTTSDAHSHNDYEQERPFWDAWNHGFGSIEADIFLVENEPHLLVAHMAAELKNKRRTLDSLYLLPLQKCLQKNAGRPYADSTKKLQILIDIKTAATPTLQELVVSIQRYPELTTCNQLQFVISGNRPSPDSFALYPPFIQFDGELNKTYTTEALKRIVLLSDNLKRYTNWDGKDSLSKVDRELLAEQITRAHSLHKPVRFWNAPDNAKAWTILTALGIDYINTDHIQLLSDFLEEKRPRKNIW